MKAKPTYLAMITKSVLMSCLLVNQSSWRQNNGTNWRIFNWLCCRCSSMAYGDTGLDWSRSVNILPALPNKYVSLGACFILWSTLGSLLLSLFFIVL